MENILYEDRDLLVTIKPADLLSQADTTGGSDHMLARVSTYIQAVNPKAQAGLVHRLDRGVGGLMVFSKKASMNAQLSELIRQREFVKEYLAVVQGCPIEPTGEYHDLLFKDSSKNKTFVVRRVRKGVKEASLEYKVVDTLPTPQGILTLVRVRLHTGRTHQIRVQFASRKMPLLGDVKYGSRTFLPSLALWSYRLAFRHPATHRDVDVSHLPPDSHPWNLFSYDNI